jgi:pyruvate formate lyase activating enzyme
LLIFNIQKYSIHDGPGIRTTVFFKGCPLACAWCHNPESQSSEAELVYQADKCIHCGECSRAGPEACPTLAKEVLGRQYSLNEVMAEIDKDALFYEQSGGGVTLSGGEPLLQIDFAAALLKRCKERGYHTAVDTCGFVPQESVERVLPWTDLFLYDIKALDDDVHERYMKAPVKPVLDNLRFIAGQGYHSRPGTQEIWLRLPFIPGVNDSPEYMRRIADLATSLGLRQIYLLPYHKIAAGKYQKLGRPYPLEGLAEPEEAQTQAAAAILQERGLSVHIGG